ncbi:cerebellar degeneration-related protein 2 isoform X3 [Halyomorpha halys]|uniref:cerebellar degeneration-related protein 2 isoform X3 n=1 Tax=Halyomorpha halys TaxID=286706 RepID=UPI0006D4E6FC|nr:cerebellar degeneration-related protein 2 isoform X2 [Halyomorpha halys]
MAYRQCYPQQSGQEVDEGYVCLFCNQSFEKDLQLAAELGKTLLERNKELETALRHHQNIAEDQAQEIEYLRKQTLALREVNDSRMKIYEQLEISIQELETSNHRLKAQGVADKKQIANLEQQVEKLEGRIEEQAKHLEEKNQLLEGRSGGGKHGDKSASGDEQLREDLSTARLEVGKHQAKLRELQTTVDYVTQENLRLEEQVLFLQRKQEEILANSEPVRPPGDICPRCLRNQETESMTGDEDDASVIDSLIADDSYQSYLRWFLKMEDGTHCESVGDLTQKDNPYRTLVEKYEELMRVEKPMPRPRGEGPKTLSLQEELELSGEFSSFTKTGGDLSEAETSSSGFSDEAVSKSTQTEAIVPPGAFLCSITDGDDCKFSIYDEASPIETRFRKTPEYRKLFREIFDVLKRAAEAKDEGESLPLLEDLTPVCDGAPKVPPVTPCTEESPQLPQEPKKRRRRRGGGKKWAEPPQSTSPAPRPTWWTAEPSSAAQEVAKLKQLEKSYAEVLRLGRQHANRK